MGTKKKKIILLVILTILVLLWVAKNSATFLDTNISQLSKSNLNYEYAPTDFNLEELKSLGVPIMLNFGAEWCPPCQEMKPDIIDMYNTYKDKMVIMYLDVDKLENGTYGLPLNAVPTQFFFDGDGLPYVPDNPQSENMMIYYDNITNNPIYTAHQGIITKEGMSIVFEKIGVNLND